MGMNFNPKQFSGLFLKNNIIKKKRHIAKEIYYTCCLKVVVLRIRKINKKCFTQIINNKRPNCFRVMILKINLNMLENH